MCAWWRRLHAGGTAVVVGSTKRPVNKAMTHPWLPMGMYVSSTAAGHAMEERADCRSSPDAVLRGMLHVDGALTATVR